MLKRVSIQNFKSLKNVSLDLQKVNLLIGPNNSGKTNFLKALEFVKERYNDFPKAGDQSLTFNRNGQDINFLIVSDNQDPVHIEKKYILKSGGEKASLVYNSKVQFAGNGVVPFIEGEKELESLLKSVVIYKPDPNKLTQPGPVGLKEEVVSTDASNLVGFLDLMLSKYRKAVFSQIETYIQTCIPEFDEINLDDAQPTQELKRLFGDKSFKRLGLGNSRQGITYWADELSEGTLYFLALLCIIHQPNPPKLLLLEEPEKGIHPRRIEEVINFILGLADEKNIQIILTTHSPIVVDLFKDMPESVFIFDKDEEGTTRVKNLQKHIIEPEMQESERLGIDPPQYLNGLGQAWKVGFIGGVPK
nr:AAA family ATPase [uncultured Arsenicibacter sp.]